MAAPRLPADHAVMTTQSIAAPHSHHTGRRGYVRFIGHFVEMLIVMFAGMGILTAVLGMPHSSPIEIQALFMAATMTAPMVAWMLIRGHSRRGSAEMGAAMVVPLAVLFPMLWTGLIGSSSILDLQHLLMLPAMLGAMVYRRTEYGL
jgi:flagellar biosynthetic protein FliP